MIMMMMFMAVVLMIVTLLFYGRLCVRMVSHYVLSVFFLSFIF